MGNFSGNLFPITVPGAITRHNPAGDPTIEKYYHKALEDGRLLEANVADANNWLLQKKQKYENDIKNYLTMNQLAVDGQLPHGPRVPKYIADSIKILQEVNKYQQEILGVVQALNQNLQLLLTMKNSLIAMAQNNLNAIANLLNNICNWNLPKLPSLPMLLGGHFHWNGFSFSPTVNFAKSLANLPKFSFNFSFSQCHPLNLGVNPSSSPLSLTSGGATYNPSALFIPPLGGQSATPQDLADPTLMQGTTTPPYYNPDTFNPNSSMLGAVPDPHTIISDYQMPPTTYQSNIVSITPVLRSNTVEPTDPDYDNPNMVVRRANLRKDLIHYITLQQVVASNYDPYITSAWLFYLQICRNGRGGNWITNFQAAYDQYIAPSLTSLANNPIPWNNVLGSLGDFYMGVWNTGTAYEAGDVTVYNNAFYIAVAANIGLEPDTNPSTWQTPPTDIAYQNTPTDIPLVDTLVAADTQAQSNILWKLSYVEASLLGYTRTPLWDGGGDSTYLSGFTGADLDYQPTTVGTNMTNEVLGSGTASYPVLCLIPTTIKAVFDEVVAQATLNIANDATYQSPYPKFKYVYDQFAEASLVDRFTQFWRTFNYNLLVFLAQDPYLVSFVVTYEGALDSAIDPLGSPTDYNVLSADAATRNRNWTPGTPLLNIPTAPVVTYANIIPPTNQTNGWLSATELDANAFLSRPDIQALPIPTQVAMLRTNISYAGLTLSLQQSVAEMDNQIANAQNLIASSQQLGFSVTALIDVLATSATPIAVAFDHVNFDMTGYTSSTDQASFTIRNAGNYAGFGQVVWDATAVGNYTITVFQNNVPIYTVTTDPSASPANPLTVPFSFTGNFAVGDVVQVVASQNTGVNQNVIPTSYFSMLLADTTSVPTTALVVTDATSDFTSDAPISALVVVNTKSDGIITPVDPFIPAITGVLVTAPYTVVLTVNAHHFKAGNIIVCSGVTLASAINGLAATVQATGTTATQITATLFTAAAPISQTTGDTGSVLYAIDSTGVVLAPIPDGITLANSGTSLGSPPTYPVPVGTEYGGVFSVAGAGFTTGGLLYAGLGGIVTQDFAALIEGVGWIICVGRAISTTNFIYEPHLPTRFANFF